MALVLVAFAACALPDPEPLPYVSFDTAVVWVRSEFDSVPVLAEVAASMSQHEVGLAGRTSLDEGSAMLFLFDEPRTGDDGFWMWRTLIPLDIAFIDEGGVIRRILSMDPCEQVSQDACPAYFPEVPHVSALETNRGWFARHGINVGASVSVVP